MSHSRLRTLGVLLLGLLASGLPTVVRAQAAATARIESSPRHHEWVTLEHDGRKVTAFVAFPEVKTKALSVVVIHENRGLNDFAKAIADRLAEDGYIAIAPDMLSGTGPNGGDTTTFASTGDATKAIGQLPGPQVLADLNAAADYVKALPAANGKVAVVGFCWGGGQTWRFAFTRKDLVLAAPFYGPVPDAPESFTQIAAPVRGFYAQNDARVNATIERAVTAMKGAGKDFEPVTYDGVGHAYMRAAMEKDANDANKKASDDSWTRLIAELKKADGK